MPRPRKLAAMSDEAKNEAKKREEKAPEKPYVPGSDHAGNPVIYHITRAVCKFYFALGGIKVVGQENIPRQGRFILAPNHASHLDPPMVSIYAPRRPHAL